MAPLPFEEAHFALALALLGALVAPPLLLGLTRLLVRDRDGFAYAAGGVASASLAFAAVLAQPAVGPTLVQRSGGWNVAFMLLVAGLTFAGFFVRLKSVRGQRPERPRPGALLL
ncbi:MAG TPA: hypothetical protein RMG45_22660, partial [Polyangiaceae bacterium LLY-WYZ-15_(1-7)]|nr:hypothetical protein [Polyangiaceae bacterium LLY-WYZ-15_(1-7)]